MRTQGTIAAKGVQRTVEPDTADTLETMTMPETPVADTMGHPAIKCAQDKEGAVPDTNISQPREATLTLIRQVEEARKKMRTNMTNMRVEEKAEHQPGVVNRGTKDTDQQRASPAS